MKRKGITAILWLLLTAQIIAQHYVSMTLDRDSVSLGEPFPISITVSLSGDPDHQGTLDFTPLDTMANLMYETDTSFFNRKGDINLLPGGTLNITSTHPVADLSSLPFQDWGGENVLKGTIIAAIYDVGQFSIPNPVLNVFGGGEILPTSPPMVKVFLPEELQKMFQDSVVMAPINPIMEEPLKLEDFRLLFIALGILIAAVILIYFTRIRKRKSAEPEVEEEIIPAHIIARQKLSQLQSRELWQKGEIKAYQSELTFIIREYLENRFRINALEMTTDEILHSIPSEVDGRKLRDILQIADMVKFAKANPPVDIHSRFMDMAFEIVDSTQENIVPVNE